MIWTILLLVPLHIARAASWIFLPHAAHARIWDQRWACDVGMHCWTITGMWTERCGRCGDKRIIC